MSLPTMAFRSAVDKLKDNLTKVKDSVLNSDIERIKSVSKLKAEEAAEASTTRKQKEADLVAAEKRANAIIDRLYPGYFKETFDPVQYELELLTNEDGYDQVEAVVERLTHGLESVSGKLSRHVMTKKDQLLNGINTVVSVDYDLKAAIAIAKGGRASLKAAGEEVVRNIRVAGQTRRKQGYMELMEVCNKIKKVTDLQQSLKTAQESGDYGDAMMMCMQAFQAVDSMKAIRVSAELRGTVQRLYVDTLHRLDVALTNICSEFRPEAYAKVLEGYLLQGCAATELAEKVLQCFKDAVHDNSARVVRSLLLTKPRLIEGMVCGTNSLDGTYGDLCRSLPVDLLRPCLLRLCEVMYELLASYHVMATWHAAAVASGSSGGAPDRGVVRSPSHDVMASSSQAAAPAAAPAAPAAEPSATASAPPVPSSAGNGSGAAVAAAASAATATAMAVPRLSRSASASGLSGTSASRTSEASSSGAAQDAAAVQKAACDFLATISDMLALSRAEMWEATARRVMELLNIPGLFKAEDFLQVVEWCQKFLGVGEAFVGSATELRQSVDAVCSQFFDVYHQANIATLQTCLQTEVWQNVASGPNGAPSIQLSANLRKSPYYVPLLGEPEAPPDFDAWIMAGNPFKRGLKTTGSRRLKMMDVLQHPGSLVGFAPSTLRLLGRSESQVSFTSTEGTAGATDALPGTPSTSALEDLPFADGAVPSISEVPDPPTHDHEDGERTSNGLMVPQEPAETSGRDEEGRALAASGGVGDGASSQRPHKRMATVTSLLMLKVVKSYVQLMRPLASRADAIFRYVTQLVDHYLLKLFIVFTNIHLDQLVFTPDIVPRRLHNCLMRILKAEGSPYRITVLQMEAYKRGEVPPPSLMGRLDKIGDKVLDQIDALGSAAETGLARISTKLEGKLGAAGASNSPARSASSISHDTTSSGSPREHPDGAAGSGGHHHAYSPNHSPQKDITAAGNLYGMRERVVALDSLVHVAEELATGRAALTAALPPSTVRELDNYFGFTLDAIADLQEVVYRRAVLQILQPLFDIQRGVLFQMASAESDYVSSRAPACHHVWADALVVGFVPLRAVLVSTALPHYAECKVWDHALAVYSDLIIEGLSRVRRCSLEGRASMSYDVMHVQRKLKVDAPSGVNVSFSVVEEYIKAFYMPWDELAHWAQAQLPVYGKVRMLTLIDCAASAFKVKSSLVRELKASIESAIM